MPPEVGHFYAEVESGEVWKDGAWTHDYSYHELKDCHDVIPEERRDWSEEGTFSKCFDPKEWNLRSNLDGTSNGERLVVFIVFGLCDIEVESNNCLDDDELIEWFDKNSLKFEQFYPKYSIDWESKADYQTETLGYFDSDFFTLGKGTVRKSALRFHEAKFYEEWYPIVPATVEEYMTIAESTLLSSEPYSNIRDSYFSHHCFLDTKK